MNEITKDKVDELYTYIQARYLWQFFPREWDRKTNIETIIKDIVNVLLDKPIDLNNPVEKYFYSEAKVVAEELKEKFEWINELSEEELNSILEKVKDKLIEILIDKSQNPELRKKNY